MGELGLCKCLELAETINSNNEARCWDCLEKENSNGISSYTIARFNYAIVTDDFDTNPCMEVLLDKYGEIKWENDEVEDDDIYEDDE